MESDDPEIVGATPAAAAAAPPAETPALELLGRWLDLSELERRTFLALARELTVSSDLVESSTLDLSERFQALALIAQAQMGRVDRIISVARSITVGGEAVPLESAMQTVQEVLLKVIDTILSVSKHAMRMVYALEDVARDVASAEQCVAQIEAINTQTRYLALNAAIEASRSGASGAPFQVIAREIKDLSRATDDTSQQVRTRISSVTRGVENGHRVLQEIATLDMSEHILAKERLDGLMSGIIGQNRAFTEVLTETAECSAEMAGTIGQLITGMQFQDRTKQHISQVIDALGVLGDGAHAVQQSTRSAFPGMFPDGALDEDLLRRLMEKQTLGAVKQRLMTRLLGNGDPADGDDAKNRNSADDGDDAGSIELF